MPQGHAAQLFVADARRDAGNRRFPPAARLTPQGKGS
jgi:hypothetical protein